MAVNAAGRRDQAVAHDRLRMRADRQLDAVGDGAVPGTPDPDDPTVLDADVRLDDTDDGVHDKGAGDDDVELGRAGTPLHRVRADRLRVAPDRLVAGCLAVGLDADPEVR